jgi:hypothetical protein
MIFPGLTFAEAGLEIARFVTPVRPEWSIAKQRTRSAIAEHWVSFQKSERSDLSRKLVRHSLGDGGSFSEGGRRVKSLNPRDRRNTLTRSR